MVYLGRELVLGILRLANNNIIGIIGLIKGCWLLVSRPGCCSRKDVIDHQELGCTILGMMDR